MIAADSTGNTGEDHGDAAAAVAVAAGGSDDSTGFAGAVTVDGTGVGRSGDLAVMSLVVSATPAVQFRDHQSGEPGR